MAARVQASAAALALAVLPPFVSLLAQRPPSCVVIKQPCLLQSTASTTPHLISPWKFQHADLNTESFYCAVRICGQRIYEIKLQSHVKFTATQEGSKLNGFDMLCDQMPQTMSTFHSTEKFQCACSTSRNQEPDEPLRGVVCGARVVRLFLFFLS